MSKEIDKKILSIKNFLSKREIDKIMSEIQNIMQKRKYINFKLKLNKKKLSFTKDRSEFDDCYYLARKQKIWPKIYDSFQHLDCYKKIVIPKVLKLSKKLISKKTKIITKGVRVIEKNDMRSYPIHQEYVGMRSSCFLVFWIALNTISVSEGGLLLSKYIPNTKLPHTLNKKKYPILPEQEKWIENSKEKKFKEGESLIVGRYVPHGTAKKTKGSPRWACLIRVGV